MLTKKFITPFGYFEVLHNGRNVEFSIEEASYNTYYLDDGSSVHPTGCYTAAIDTINMKPGDIVIARYSKAGLVCDGGGEHTLNAVVELDDFTIGMGCADTDDLEELWDISKNEIGADPKDFQTLHLFPYEHWDITKERDGFEFHIIDDPRTYARQYTYGTFLKRYERTTISLALVWNENDDEYAGDIVSVLTC